MTLISQSPNNQFNNCLYIYIQRILCWVSRLYFDVVLIFVHNENDARLLTKLSLFVPRVSASSSYSYFVLSLRLRLYTREATMPFRSGQGSFFTRHRITVSLPLLIFNQAARPLRTNDFLFLTDGRPRARVTPVEQPVVTANGWTRERASCPQSFLAQLT